MAITRSRFDFPLLWIVLAQPSIYLEIEADMRNGDVAYQLSRPLSYVGAKLAAALGECAKLFQRGLRHDASGNRCTT